MGLMKLKMCFFKTSNESALLIYQSNLFHSVVAEVKKSLKYSCLTKKENFNEEFCPIFLWRCVILFVIVLKTYDGDSLFRTLYKNPIFLCQRIDFKESKPIPS